MTAVPQRSITDRMRGAALLDVDTYEELEADRSATGQAFVVVAIVAICQAIGGAGEGAGGVFSGLVGAMLGWMLWSALTMLIGTRLFGGTADWGELLRTLGFAQTPGILAIFGIIPILGWLFRGVAAIWILVAAIVAIRQALDFSTGKAIATAVVGWLCLLLLMLVLNALFGTMGGMLRV